MAERIFRPILDREQERLDKLLSRRFTPSTPEPDYAAQAKALDDYLGQTPSPIGDNFTPPLDQLPIVSKQPQFVNPVMRGEATFKPIPNQPITGWENDPEYPTDTREISLRRRTEPLPPPEQPPVAPPRPPTFFEQRQQQERAGVAASQAQSAFMESSRRGAPATRPFTLAEDVAKPVGEQYQAGVEGVPPGEDLYGMLQREGVAGTGKRLFTLATAPLGVFKAPAEVGGGVLSAAGVNIEPGRNLAREVGIQPNDDVSTILGKIRDFQRTRPEAERFITENLALLALDPVFKGAAEAARIIGRGAGPAARATGKVLGEVAASEVGGSGKRLTRAQISDMARAQVKADIEKALTDTTSDHVYVSPQRRVTVAGKEQLVNTMSILEELGAQSAKNANTYKPLARPAPAARVAKGQAELPTTPAVAPSAAKQPWEMTFGEFVQSESKRQGGGGWAVTEGRNVARDHEQLVQQALSEGKPVPANVLAEYPDLAAKAAPATQPTTPAVAPSPPAAAAERAGTPPAAPAATPPSIEERIASAASMRAKALEDTYARAPAARAEAKAMLRDVKVGDTVHLGAVPFRVIDASDPSLLTVESIQIPGPPRKVGRAAITEGPLGKAANAKTGPAKMPTPPTTAPVRPQAPAQAVQPSPTQPAATAGLPRMTPDERVALQRAEAERLRREALPVQVEGRGPEVPPSGAPPRGPTPTTGAVPPTQLMADLAPMADVTRAMQQPNFLRTVSNLPGVRSVMPAIDPTQIAKKPVDVAIISREVLRNEGTAKAQGVMAYLQQLGDEAKVFGKRDASGLIGEGTLKGASVNDIRTYPNRYPLNSAQKAWVEAADQIEQAKLAMLRRNGIDVRELSFEEGGRYAGRRYYAKMDAQGNVVETAVGAGPSRIGAKAGFEKTRTYATEAEAIADGFRPLTQAETLALNVRAAYNRVADEQMAEWLLNRVDWRNTGAPDAVKLAAEVAQNQLRKALTFKAVVERTLRGEAVPETTLNSIAAAYPTEVGKLKGAIFSGDNTAIRALRADADALRKTASDAWRQAVNARARAGEAARTTHFDEASVMSPAFQGKVLTGKDAKEIGRRLNDAMGVQGSKFLEGLNQVNLPARMYEFAGDFSSMLIQLGPMAFYKPAVWGRTWQGALKAMVSDRFHAKYLADNLDTINASRGLVLSRQGLEATSGANQGAMRYLSIPFKPFVRFYDASMDVAGIEMRKALAHMAKTPEETMQVEQFINDLRGLSPSVGLSAVQKQAETAAILAARYNRATASLLTSVIRGDIRGAEARKALASFVAGGAALTAAYSYARGEDPTKRLTPMVQDNRGRWRRNPEFALFNVEGQMLGPGGKILSVMRLLTDMVANGIDTPEDLVTFIDAQGPNMNNPMLRFVRGNLAPLPSSTLDVLTGRDFIGNPTNDSVLHFGQNIVARNLMPVWLNSVAMQGGTETQKVERGVAEFAGMRAIPQSESAKFAQYVEQQTGKPYGKLNKLQIDQFKTDGGQGQQLWEAAQKDKIARGRESPATVQYRTLRESRDATLKQGADTVRAGGATVADLNEAIKKANQDYGAQLDAVEKNPQYAEDIRKMRTQPPSTMPEDAAYEMYQKMVNDPSLDRGIEGYDYAKRDRLTEQFKQAYGPEMFAYVQARQVQDRKRLDPLVQDIYTARDALKPYWEVWKTARLTPKAHDLYEQWDIASSATKADIEREPLFKAAQKIVTQERQRMRAKDAALDLAVTMLYGNGEAFANPDNVKASKAGKLTFGGVNVSSPNARLLEWAAKSAVPPIPVAPPARAFNQSSTARMFVAP